MTKNENQNWSFLYFLPKSKVTSEFAQIIIKKPIKN